MATTADHIVITRGINNRSNESIASRALGKSSISCSGIDSSFDLDFLGWFLGILMQIVVLLLFVVLKLLLLLSLLYE